MKMPSKTDWHQGQRSGDKNQNRQKNAACRQIDRQKPPLVPIMVRNRLQGPQLMNLHGNRRFGKLCRLRIQHTPEQLRMGLMIEAGPETADNGGTRDLDAGIGNQDTETPQASAPEACPLMRWAEPGHKPAKSRAAWPGSRCWQRQRQSTTSRGKPGDETHLPVGECLTRKRGRKKDEKTDFNI